MDFYITEVELLSVGLIISQIRWDVQTVERSACPLRSYSILVALTLFRFEQRTLHA